MLGAIVILIVGFIVYIMAYGAEPYDYGVGDAFFWGLIILAVGFFLLSFAFAPGFWH